MVLRYSSVRLDTNSGDQEAVQVFNEDRLLAILTRLADPVHGENVGRWCVEVDFRRCSGTTQIFSDLDSALTWIGRQARPALAPVPDWGSGLMASQG